MELILYVIILALAVNLMANMIWKYLPYTDRRADVWATVIIIIVCILIIISRKEDPKIISGQQPTTTQIPKYEIVPHAKVSWQQLISEAKFRVYATGIIASSIEPQTLVEKVKNNEQFEAKVILLKPDGRVVEMRADDENMPRNPGKIADRLLSFRELSDDLLNQRAKARMSVKYIDVYPTISVFIIDHNLYAYFYPYRARGISSPVIVFRNIQDNMSDENNLAVFFQKHFKAIEEAAKSPTEEDYIKYEKLSVQKK